MVATEIIEAQLANVLETTNFTGAGERRVGKVRDSYLRGRERAIVVTDRISAFDCVLGTIPFKGQVLNRLAAFWFEKTRDVAPNHVVAVPDANVMIVRECEQLPLEFVVRGYITGVTDTSAWTNYARGVRNLCGNVLPEGLRKDQKLDRPIITPTTKHEKHDRNISRDEAMAEGLIDGPTFDKAADICLRLYERAVEHAAANGLIFVDTKYELGLLDGMLIVTDEINTPDSSRYWFADTYADRFARGEEQRKLDKEYVRQWLADQGFRGEGVAPALTDAVRVEAARRYIEAYEMVTGEAFVPDLADVATRVARALGADGVTNGVGDGHG
jgi:phosphoribosylaminoimidazole-succinocarboxamide synthase